MIDEKYTLLCDNSLENIENKDDDAVNKEEKDQECLNFCKFVES